MSLKMYEPDKKSRLYLYIFFFSALILLVGIYSKVQVLRIQNDCSEIAQRTSKLTKDFNTDPFSNFEQIKSDCESNLLSAKTKRK